jgi:uncharacterized membrane protein (UPF0127 family)
MRARLYERREATIAADYESRHCGRRGQPRFLQVAAAMRDHFLLSARNGPCRLAIDRTGATFVSDIEIARDSATRRRGLLGRLFLEADRAFVIAPCQGVHTFGMRFAIDIVAADRNGRVIKLRSRVRPGRVVLAWSAFAIIELAAGVLDCSDLRKGDRLVCQP